MRSPNRFEARWGLVLGVLLAGRAEAGNEPLAWIPADTRAVFSIDPAQAAQQPKSRAFLGLDPVLGGLVVRRVPAEKVESQLIAYVQSGTVAEPVVLTRGRVPFGRQVESALGGKLETSGGVAVHASKDREAWGVALVAPDLALEGPRQTLRAVLEHVAARGPTLADLPAERIQRRLLDLPAGRSTAVSLVYAAPGDGKNLYEVLIDLDRILGAEMGAGMASYQSALRALGTVQGLRLDLAQGSEDLGTTLRLAMPSGMAAQIASVSLTAGKDMARAASDAAVQAGSLSESDGAVLSGALQTLQARAEGDLVVVQLRVPEGGTQSTAR